MRKAFLAALVLIGLAVGVPESSAGPPREASTCDPTAGLGALPTASPLGTSDCRGVQPGGVVLLPDTWCSLNFMFTDAKARRYIGTAGHCVLDEGAEAKVWPTNGPIARDIDGEQIGRVVFATLTGYSDIALIKLDSHVPASAQLVHFGGPTTLYTERTLGPTVLHHNGHGLGFGSLYTPSAVAPSSRPGPATVSARTAITYSTLDPYDVAATGVAAWGDSGSAVVDGRGQAVGVLVRLGGGSIPWSMGALGISRLDHQLPLMEQALRTSLTLMTAPFRPVAP